MSSFKLVIPPKAEYLSLVRSFTQEIVNATPTHQPQKKNSQENSQENSPQTPLQQTTMQQQKTYELLIAVSEVTTNAINSHIEARTSKPITLNYKFKKDSVTVEVADKGTGFNPKKLEPLPKVTDPERLLHESGLGISLYKSYTDDHRIKSSSNGTRVLITKNYS